MSFFFNVTLILFLGLCLLFALLILIQKGRGGGISAAFGGAGGNTAFGSKTGDVLTWATSVVFLLFLILCVVLNLQATAVDNAYRGRTAAAPGATEASDTNAPPPPVATPPSDPTTQLSTLTPANIAATATTVPATSAPASTQP